jgi:hypothetical protein
LLALDANILIEPVDRIGDRAAGDLHPIRSSWSDFTYLPRWPFVPDAADSCPEDEPELKDLVKRLPAEDVRMRFFQPIRELSHEMAAR